MKKLMSERVELMNASMYFWRQRGAAALPPGDFEQVPARGDLLKVANSSYWIMNRGYPLLRGLDLDRRGRCVYDGMLTGGAVPGYVC